MQLSYIKLFVDCLDCIEPLDDAERGRLFTALLTYARTGEAPVLQGNERFLFPMLRAQLDRDAAAYETLCETNRRSGTKGGQAPRKRALANASQEEEKDKEEDQDEEKEKDFSSGASRPRQAEGLRARRAGPARTSGPRKQREKSVSQQRQEVIEDNQRYFEQMNRYLEQLRREAVEARKAEEAAKQMEGRA